LKAHPVLGQKLDAALILESALQLAQRLGPEDLPPGFKPIHSRDPGAGHMRQVGGRPMKQVARSAALMRRYHYADL